MIPLSPPLPYPQNSFLFPFPADKRPHISTKFRYACKQGRLEGGLEQGQRPGLSYKFSLNVFSTVLLPLSQSATVINLLYKKKK